MPGKRSRFAAARTRQLACQAWYARRVDIRSAALLVVFALPAACSSASYGAGGCPARKSCNSGTPEGTPASLRADGTVDITPEQAWPFRATEPAHLSATELGRS